MLPGEYLLVVLQRTLQSPQITATLRETSAKTAQQNDVKILASRSSLALPELQREGEADTGRQAALGRRAEPGGLDGQRNVGAMVDIVRIMAIVIAVVIVIATVVIAIVVVTAAQAASKGSGRRVLAAGARGVPGVFT